MNAAIHCTHWDAADPRNLPEGYEYEFQWEHSDTENVDWVKCCHRSTAQPEWICGDPLEAQVLPEPDWSTGLLLGCILVLALWVWRNWRKL
jgi:hypothetical protein